MIDCERYVRLRDKGFAWIDKSNPSEIYVKFKRFSVEDGSEIVGEPEKQLFDHDEIVKERERAEKLAFNINEFLRDLTRE